MMSALPPKADIAGQKMDVRFVQKADSWTATKRRLFDHVIGARTQGLRHLEAQLVCRLQIDHQVELRRILHWKIGGHGALKNAS